MTTHAWRTSSPKPAREPIRSVDVFRLYDMELTNGRTSKKHALTKSRDAQNHEKSIAEALVATGDPRKRCPRSQAWRLQTNKREEDCGVTETIGRAQFAPQGRGLSLGAFDADLLYQPRRQDAAEDPAHPIGAREGRVEAPVRARVIVDRLSAGHASEGGYRVIAERCARFPGSPCFAARPRGRSTMVAFSARRLVCSAIAVISLTTSPICCAARDNLPMRSSVFRACATAASARHCLIRDQLAIDIARQIGFRDAPTVRRHTGGYAFEPQIGDAHAGCRYGKHGRQPGQDFGPNA